MAIIWHDTIAHVDFSSRKLFCQIYKLIASPENVIKIIQDNSSYKPEMKLLELGQTDRLL